MKSEYPSIRKDRWEVVDQYRSAPELAALGDRDWAIERFHTLAQREATMRTSGSCSPAPRRDATVGIWR